MGLFSRRRTWLTAGVAVVVVAGGTATAYARSSGDATGSYRTVAATRGAVEEMLSLSGTVDSAHRADATFGVAGTVASVTVRQGRRVKAGAVLMTLDDRDLRATLTKAQAALAEARAQLETDENAQADAVTSTSTGAASPKAPTVPKGGAPKSPKTPSGPATPSAPSSPTGGSAGGVQTQAVKDALATLKTQQDAVTSAQSAATAALSDAQAALTAQTAACKDAFTAPTGGGTPTAGATAGADCQAALSKVQDAQQAVEVAQGKLADALTALIATLQEAVGLLDQAAGGTTASPTSSRVSGRAASSRTVTTVAYVRTADDTTQASGATSGATSGQAGAQTVTAATLARDQASIDTARADVISARQGVDQAVVRAPITGTVVEVAPAVGDAVSAGDTAAVVTDGTSLLVGTTVTETKIRDVKVGQVARVRTPGSSVVSSGTVSTIGVTADATSGTASYPVTIAVPTPKAVLPSGSSVQVEIVVGTAEDVVTVPSSAVTKIGTRAIVRTLVKGQLTPVPVTLGLVGARRTAVTKGLSAGTRVVLADLGQAVTGASTSLTNNRGFTPGQFRPGGAGGGTRPGGTGGAPAG
jgi:HlyD family secretion protein